MGDVVRMTVRRSSSRPPTLEGVASVVIAAARRTKECARDDAAEAHDLIAGAARAISASRTATLATAPPAHTVTRVSSPGAPAGWSSALPCTDRPPTVARKRRVPSSHAPSTTLVHAPSPAPPSGASSGWAGAPGASSVMQPVTEPRGAAITPRLSRRTAVRLR